MKRNKLINTILIATIVMLIVLCFSGITKNGGVEAQNNFSNSDNTNETPTEEYNEISSVEDLKKYLDYVDVDRNNILKNINKKLLLKEGNYKLTNDIEIDLDDPYFADKKDNIKYGIIYANKDFKFDGNGKKISFKQNEAYALFGAIQTSKFEIKNLNISYPKDVLGFTFANVLTAGGRTGERFIANGLIKNVTIDVAGDVKPLEYNVTNAVTNFNGTFKGYLSTGFSWYMVYTSMEDVKININGNIGNQERPEKPTDMVGAFGITFYYTTPMVESAQKSETWKELHDKGNAEVLKEAGHITNIDLNVGKNIQAFGNNAGYATGLGQDLGEAWMDNIKTKIGGDIIVDLIGNNERMYGNDNYIYAYGISEEIMNYTNSTLEVNNIILNTKNQQTKPYLVMIGALASDNSKGNYINNRNNIINVKGKIKADTDKTLVANVGFGNADAYGTSTLLYDQDNKYNVGSVELKTDQKMQFDVLGNAITTGENRMGKYVLPEASLNNNNVNIGDIKITAENDFASVSLMQSNASNAKNNHLNYGNIDINSKEVRFTGIGNVSKTAKSNNPYKYVTSNNHISMKNLNIKTQEAPRIALLVGILDEGEKVDNCSVTAEKVNVEMTANKVVYLGGIAGYSEGEITNCAVNIGSINAENQGTGNLYFGLGIARQNNSIIKNCSAFIDSDVKIGGPNVYGGGFLGFTKLSEIENCNIQIDGEIDIQYNDGMDGGFAGWITDSNIKNSTSLMLNSFAGFAGYGKSGTMDSIAHYTNGKAPKYYSGLLLSGTDKFKVTNSTLLVEKDYDDTILYRKDSVSNDSGNNYLVVVDNANSADNFNRKAYKTEESKATLDEMEAEIPVVRKGKEDAIGKINIKPRTFQEKYWNKNISKYAIGNDEKDFEYMNANEAGNISTIGIDKEKIGTADGTKAKLYDYYHRHLGLKSDSGIIYDLLGIKGSIYYSIKYDGNGADKGDNPEDKNKYKPEEDVTILSNGNLERKGYRFVGWNTKKDGTGKSYNPNDLFKITEDTILYAMWKKSEPLTPMEPPIRNVDVNIKWKDENAKEIKSPTDKMYVQLYKNGVKVGKVVELNESNNWKYTFNKLKDYDKLEKEIKKNIYTVKEVYEEKELGQDDKFTIDKNEYLVDISGTMKDGYTITNSVKKKEMPKPVYNYVKFVDSKKEIANVKVEKGKSINSDKLIEEKMPEDPKKEGYIFIEWNTKEDGKGEKFTGDTIVNKNMTVYAIYKMKQLEIIKAPILSVKDITITVGDELDLRSLIVNAETNELKDAKTEVKIIDKGGFDNNKVGVYKVKYMLKDKIGSSVTKIAKVTVIGKTDPEPKPNPKPEPNPDPQPKPKPEPKPEPKPDPDPKPNPEPEIIPGKDNKHKTETEVPNKNTKTKKKQKKSPNTGAEENTMKIMISLFTISLIILLIERKEMRNDKNNDNFKK